MRPDSITEGAIAERRGSVMNTITRFVILILSIIITPIAVLAFDFEHHIPGTVEGIGTRFEVTDSEHQNIVLQSSQPVSARVESTAGGISILLTGTGQLQLELDGLTPHTTYYKYIDTLDQVESITADFNGNLLFAIELIEARWILVSKEPSTVILNSSGGDCQMVGDWDPLSTTCTLTTDVYETIQIGGGVTLDGAGHTVDGQGNTYACVYFAGSAWATVRNIKVQNCSVGVYVYGRANHNLMEEIEVTGNNTGIGHHYFNHNITLANSSIHHNGIGGHYGSTTYSTFTGNKFFSNNYSGIWLHGSNDYNTITGNHFWNNGGPGISIVYTDGLVITNNVFEDNGFGLGGIGNKYNLVAGNVITRSEKDGIIWVSGSSGNNSAYNTVQNNIVEHNGYGIGLGSPVYGNQIHNNLFNNMQNFHMIYTVRVSPNVWNTDKIDLPNIIGGPFSGGNVWSKPDGSGFSDTCDDENHDGICDLALTLTADNTDQLPLKRDYVIDSDGDGIPDIDDSCPDENSLGFDADQDGCLDTTDGLISLIQSMPDEALADQIKNSLVSKVEAARQSKEDGLDNAAVNQLEALINEINALRGHSIDEQVADLLIAYAQNIIALVDS